MGSEVYHPLSRVRGRPPPPCLGSEVYHLPLSRVKGQPSPPPSRLHTGTTVNGREVRILLECILVSVSKVAKRDLVRCVGHIVKWRAVEGILHRLTQNEIYSDENIDLQGL